MPPLLRTPEYSLGHVLELDEKVLMNSMHDLTSFFRNGFPDNMSLPLFASLSLYLSADEGYYQSGKFQFEIDVPEAYNMVVSGACVCVCVPA